MSTQTPPGYAGDRTDSSRPRSPLWLWALTLALLGVVVWMQRPEPPDLQAEHRRVAGLDVKAPQVDPMILVARLIEGFKADSPMYAQQMNTYVDGMAGWSPDNPFAGAVSAANPPKKRKHPEPAADRLRATIVTGETLGPAELDWRLKDIEKDLDAESPLRGDVDLVRKLYSVAPDSAGKFPAAPAPPLSATDRAALGSGEVQGFRTRHGWFADLALTRGDTDALFRRDLRSSGQNLIMGVLGVAALGVVWGMGVLAASVTLIIFAALGRFRVRGFMRPDPGAEWPAEPEARRMPGDSERRPGSVWLETVAVFLTGFLGVKLASMGLHVIDESGSWTITATLALQWMLVTAIFWPVVRGMSWERWRGEIGWHTGRGVWREIGSGLLAYYGAAPLYFLLAIVVFLIASLAAYLMGNDPPSADASRLFDIISDGGFLQKALLFSLAVFWAPIVEESIFRGALYRHLRRSWPVWVAALGSAAVFAAMHGYMFMQLVLVGSLGLMFALMREWRGSLIPSVTAHAVHNFTALTLQFVIVQIMRP